MKVLGCILIFLACTLMGTFKWFSLKKRCANLMDIKNVTENLKAQIGFLKNDLPTAFFNAALGHSVFSLYKNCAENIINLGVDQAWEEGLRLYAHSLFFTKDDIKTLKTFSHNLGKTDTESQLHTLDIISAKTEELYQNALCDYREKGSLYKTAGSAIGVFLVLLLI